MEFKYRAYPANDPKAIVENTLNADSKEVAEDILRSRGFIPLDVKPHSTKADLKNMQIGRKAVKIRELAVFTRQLSTMIKAGMSPLSSIEVVARPIKNQFFKDALKSVQDSINTGSDLSSAFAEHPKIFKPIYISLVEAGEASGNLDESLERLATQLEKDAQLRSEVKSAMIYPIVVVVFAMVIIVAMMLFVIPVFATLFEDTGGSLPAPTQLLVNVSEIVKKYWFLLPFIPVAIYYAVKQILATEKGRRAWDTAKINMPMKIGPLYLKIVTARITRTLSTLQSSGVPIIQAIEITSPTASNVVIQDKFKQTINKIKQGEDISQALKTVDELPDMALAMIEAGEEAGELPQMLSKVADTYEEEVELAIKGLKSIMEPIMIIGIGGLVGFIVISLYLPIFKIYDAIK